MKIKGYWYYEHLIENTNMWATNNNKILNLKDENKYTIAHWMGWRSKILKWVSDNQNILMLKAPADSSEAIKGDRTFSVVANLASGHPHWATTNEILLRETDVHLNTVNHILIEKGKL